jgi:predicted dehydrogenase
MVGFGYAAATFHAPLIASVPGLRLKAIASSNAAKVQSAWPDVPVCDSPESLFARPDIDLIVLPTPNDTHYPLAAQALAAGKHVVVDKPFTLTAAEARDLLARADAAGRLLSVFHNRRWDADFLTIQRLLSSAELGRLTHVESHFDRYRPQVRVRWRESDAPGSGLWYDLGAHLIDQALCLFGMPRTIALDLAQQRDGALTDDWFHAVLRYDRLRVVLHASALVADLGPRFILHGTQGSYTKFGLDTQEEALKAGLPPVGEQWGYDPVPGTLSVAAPGDQNGKGEMRQRTYENARGDYTRYYAGLRDAIVRGAPNPVPASDALRVMRLIELGMASFADSRVMSLDQHRESSW